MWRSLCPIPVAPSARRAPPVQCVCVCVCLCVCVSVCVCACVCVRQAMAGVKEKQATTVSGCTSHVQFVSAPTME